MKKELPVDPVKELPVDLVRRAQTNLLLLKEQQNIKLQIRKAEWEAPQQCSTQPISDEAFSNPEQESAAWPSAKGDRIPSVLSKNKDGQWEHTYFIDMSGSSWLSAVEAADEGNPVFLCETLCTEDEVLGNDGRALIRDLLDRHKPFPQQQLAKIEPWSMGYRQVLAILILANGLKKKRGRPSTPIYARSDLDARLDCATAEVRAWRKVFGSRHPDIVSRVAALHNVAEKSLRDELAGKRGATQRKTNRRKKYLRADD